MATVVISIQVMGGPEGEVWCRDFYMHSTEQAEHVLLSRGTLIEPRTS